MVLDIGYDPPDRNPGKPWKWIIIDSLIIALIVFVASLPEHLPSLEELYLALKTCLYVFLVQISVERGIKPYYKKWKNGRKKHKHLINEPENGETPS